MKDAGDGLRSERLRLRRFTADDLDFLDRLNSDPEVTRYTGGLKSRAESQDMLDQRILRYYGENPGLGIWVTEERATGAAVGLHLLNHMRGETLIQVGYLLLPQYWGRGYGSEMCKALLWYGYADLQLPLITAITDPRNSASRRVLEKCGMRYLGERMFEGYKQYGAQAYFERARADWLAEQG